MKTSRLLTLLLFAFFALTVSYNSSSQELVGNEKESRQSGRLPTKKELELEKIKVLETLKNGELNRENPEKLFAAIERAGELRLVEAIPDLLNLLGVRQKLEWEGSGMRLRPIPEEGYYPAVSALLLIGKPALPALVEVIEDKDESSIESHNALSAIETIYREDMREAVVYLRRATANPKSSESRERLLIAAGKTAKKAGVKF